MIKHIAFCLFLCLNFISCSCFSPKQAAPSEALGATAATQASTNPNLGGEGRELLLRPNHFAFDSDEITAADRSLIDAKIAYMKSHPKTTIRIEGRCDERGSREYNLELGERRANAVKYDMIDHGIDSKRITTYSYGKDNPINPGHNEAAWAENRRDGYVITKE